MKLLDFTFALRFSCLAIGVFTGEKEEWGYVNVRKDAYMFWWLYYTDQVGHHTDYPLIIWIQGGPGVSGTGLGNFLEVGPLDVHLKPRNFTWLKKANLLFLDNPVGTGFSYVTNNSALAPNNRQITNDLMATVHFIFDKVPEFQQTPLYIFSESYGGKMTVDFALALIKASRNKEITCNFQSITLGDSWISPLDHLYSWGNYLYTMSLLDKNELEVVTNFVHEIKRTMKKRQYEKATGQFEKLEILIDNFTNSIDWFNILKNKPPADRPSQKDLLRDLMNGPIRQKLRVIPNNVTWNYQTTDVFKAIAGDFMKNVIASVDRLLINESHIDVNIFSAQFDLIVNTLGTLTWIDKLKWIGMKDFQVAPKRLIELPENRTGGFVKSFKQLTFFWILKAGHMVPADAPETAFQMLNTILSKRN